MSKIKKIKLHNFESWINKEIEFSSGLNVIIGNSDSGKSGLFRAIKSVLIGEASKSQINKKSDEFLVEVEFDNKNKFSRVVGKNKNNILENNNEYKSINNGIPTSYFDLLGNTEMELSDKTKIQLCIREQDDKLFFLSSSKYEKPKIISSACGIDIVDKILDNINSDVRKNKDNSKSITLNINNNEIKAEEDLKKANELSNKLNKQEVILNKINNNFNSLIFIDNHFSKIKDVNIKIISTNISLKNNENIIKIINLLKINTFENLIKIYEHINILNSKKSSFNETINKGNVIINSVSNFKYNKINELYNIYDKLITINNNIIDNKKLFNNKQLSFINKSDKLMYFNNILSSINNNKNNIENISNEIKGNDGLLMKLQYDKNNLLKDIKKCPLCGSNICVD